MAAEPYFEISTIQDRDGCHTVSLSGALDSGSTPHLEAVLGWILLSAGTREVIVDLADLHYLGATGSRALVEAARAAEDLSIKLWARNAQGLVETILRLTEVANILRLPASALDDVTDAGHRHL